jgi:SPP1 gp7 family putative phage head morphogenesis protein
MEYLNGCILIEQEEMKELVHKDSLDKNFNEIDAGEDVIEESDDYSTYLEKKVSSWENKVIKAIENIEIEKSFDYNKKTFGEFLSGLMNAINTKGFLNNIRRFIKININSSIESVEEELNLNIGFTSKFDDLLDKFTIEQFDGYNINGKRWPGIKGATKQTQFKILKTVEENLANGNTRAEMIKNVRGVFKGSTLKQATAIARTETTRFLAEAKLLSYKESGVEGNKAPSAANDSRTSELCRRLDAKYRNIGVPLDEEYYDDVTGKSFQNPNHHVNCRCTLEFIPSKK